MGPSEIPGAVDRGARGRPGHHLDSRHARLAARCAPRNLHQLSGFSLRSARLARRRSSTGSMFPTPATTASTRTALCWRATRAMARSAPLDAPSDELIPLPERSYAGGPTSLRGFSINAAGPRDPETGFPIGGAGALVNSTEAAAASATASVASATRSALCSFTTWATCLPMPATPGPAPCASTSRIETHARCSPRLLPSHRRCLPFRRARPDRSPPPASRASAASTTSPMRRDWACATIRRSGPFASTSAIT